MLFRSSVVTIGAFDGVHRGHQAVISDLLGRSREFGLPSTVILFEPLPREYFAPVQSPPRLMSFREKFMVLRHLGVDRVLRIRFDRQRGAVDKGANQPNVFVDPGSSRPVPVAGAASVSLRKAGISPSTTRTSSSTTAVWSDGAAMV